MQKEDGSIERWDAQPSLPRWMINEHRYAASTDEKMPNISDAAKKIKSSAAGNPTAAGTQTQMASSKILPDIRWNKYSSFTLSS